MRIGKAIKGSSLRARPHIGEEILKAKFRFKPTFANRDTYRAVKFVAVCFGIPATRAHGIPTLIFRRPGLPMSGISVHGGHSILDHLSFQATATESASAPEMRTAGNLQLPAITKTKPVNRTAPTDSSGPLSSETSELLSREIKKIYVGELHCGMGF